MILVNKMQHKRVQSLVLCIIININIIDGAYLEKKVMRILVIVIAMMIVMKIKIIKTHCSSSIMSLSTS